MQQENAKNAIFIEHFAIASFNELGCAFFGRFLALNTAIFSEICLKFLELSTIYCLFIYNLDMQKQHIKRKVIIIVVIILLTLLTMLLLKSYPGFFFPIYRNISKTIINIVSSITSIVPFTLWDILLFIFIILFIYLLIRSIKNKKNILKLILNTILIISILLSFTVLTFMNNHYGPSLASEINLCIFEYSIEELKEATAYYLTSAIELADQIERDENNNSIEYDFYEIAKIAGKSYEELAKTYAIFKGSTKPVKKLSLLGDHLLYNGIVGIYMPVTCESGIPSNVYNIEKPFVMAHEASHRLAIASEEDSNFAAFLACINNDDVRFKYSGYYSAFEYCFSTLCKYNKEEAIALVKSYNGLLNYDLFINDYNNSIDYYKKYESKLEDISHTLNDNYLKIFNQEGTISYGKVTDELVCYYTANAH